MHSRKSDPENEGNTSFDLAEPELEHPKPGLVYDVERDPGAVEGEDAEGQHRLAPSPRKEIPQKTLADRIRDESKGD